MLDLGTQASLVYIKHLRTLMFTQFPEKSPWIQPGSYLSRIITNISIQDLSLLTTGCTNCCRHMFACVCPIFLQPTPL